MWPNRESAMEEFSEAADLDRKVLEVVSKILSKSPRAILIVWETDQSVGMTSVPFSHSLIKGMVDTAFDIVFLDKEEVTEDEQDD